MSYDWYGDYHQMTVDELRVKAKRIINAEKAKGIFLEPITFTENSRKIATSWWGKAWCDNLERYADFESRLGRGKRYVKGNTVIDLNIIKGKILSRVVGSQKTPYDVEIEILPLSEEKLNDIIEKCGKKVENLDDLLQGKFPEEMKELFKEDGGLFPTPDEIIFSCSCPDWASMCKHIAAVLYGVGVRLDENPALFFTLRGLNVNQFIDTAIANRLETMLSNADKTSDRIIAENEVKRLFGV